MDVAISVRINIAASTEVGNVAGLGTGAVIVFGEIDGAVGVDAFNPHDVTPFASGRVGDSMRSGCIIDDEAGASGAITPAIGVAPV